MAMRMKYLIYFLLPLLLLSCGKEQDSNLLVDKKSEGAKETYTISYSAIINGSEVTRATLGEGGSFASGYVFQSGDRLFVSYESGGNSLYGVLNLTDGAGTSTGEFEGDLTCSAGFYPGTSNPVINFTLVGVNAATGFYTISDDKITTGPSYPSVIDYTSETLAGMVEKYSHFTASGNFTSNSFTLQQQSVFLDFSIKFDASVLGGSTPETVSVSLKPSSDGTAIFTANNVSLTDGKLVSFVGVFQAGNDLQGQGIYVSGIHCEPDFAADLTLAANKYYSVERNTFHWDGFRIKATVANTTVTFDANYAANIEYSEDGGYTWTSGTTPCTLVSVNDEMCVRGNRTNYTNYENANYDTPASHPLFSTSNNKLVYIAGNIMSLLNDANSLEASAFHGTFSKGTSNLTYIDISETDPLYLPVTTLASKCYTQMFRQCTSLTHAPTFTVEGAANRCCYNMFRGCSNLSDISSISLPAVTMYEDCYREMFRLCSSLTDVSSLSLPATQLATSCYQQMFQATGITTAPNLPAPTLVTSCYSEMFRGCTNLNYIKCLAKTGINSNNSTSNWVTDVSASGTFVKYSDIPWPTSGNGIPSGWTVQEATQ